MGQSGPKREKGRIGFHGAFCRTDEKGRPVALSLDEGLMKGERGLNCALREGGGGDPQPLRKKRAGGPEAFPLDFFLRYLRYASWGVPQPPVDSLCSSLSQ